MTTSAKRGFRAWGRDLALGVRLAVTGGRESWIRTTLTAVGVGLGVAMLLGASAIPAMMQARSDRSAARDELVIGAEPMPAAPHTVVLAQVDTSFRGDDIRGRLIRADGANPVRPPGVPRLPGPGEMVVSPALKDLLESADGALLRPRLPYRTVGTIGDEGLSGPREYGYIAGSDTLTAESGGVRLDHFGETNSGEGLDAVLMLLVVVILVVLLLPIGVFVAAAVRFGGERRDRRLAALRLVGADGAMTRRIAAGESAVGAFGGLLAGTVFFFLGRQLAPLVDMRGLSVFPADIRPSVALTLLIAVTVPVSAIGVTLLSLRRVVIEPLGVVRRAGGRRRRLWWRLILPVAGLALLYPLLGNVSGAQSGDQVNSYQVAAGTVLLLVGITAVLPWLVESTVHRLGGAGAVPWQLAVRRLQLDVGSSTRMINGIAVAAAGGIALQMLFGAVDQNYLIATGQDPNRAQVVVNVPPAGGGDIGNTRTRFEQVPGVRAVRAVTRTGGTVLKPDGTLPPEEGREGYSIMIADCATLSEFVTFDRCADGDTFITQDPTDADEEYLPRPGTRMILDSRGETDVDGPRWTLPKDTPTLPARTSPVGWFETGILITPAAIGANAPTDARVTAYLTIDQGDPDVYERIRNAAAGIAPTSQVNLMAAILEKPRFASIRRGLFIGVVLTLLLIGASLLVSTLEQLRDRRKLLAVLIAFGTRRGTLVWSVLWQTAVPVFLGLILAMVVGVGLGAVLLGMVEEKIRIDWISMAQITGAGGGVVLLVTALSLPALWRMMRPDGLRTE